MKFRNADGSWKSIAAFKGEDGKDGAIQYRPGPGINISEDNVISTTFTDEGGMELTVDTQPIAESTNPVSSGGVFTALQDKADKSEIKTDTSELTNGAGFITGDDVPKDLGDFDNEAGFLKEETDPLFRASVAAGITADNINNWNKIQDLHICPIAVPTAYRLDESFEITSTAILNKVKTFITAFGAGKLLLHLHTGKRSNLYSFVSSVVSGNESTGDFINTYSCIMDVDTYGTVRSSKLAIYQSRSTGAYRKITVSAFSWTLPKASNYLSKTNTTSYTPTADYHPATKAYVDKAVSDGLSGGGGIVEETDPTVPVWVKGITEEDISKWNSKLSDESDPTVPSWVKSITEADITNWNSKADIADIPSDLGDFGNAAGYIKEELDPLFAASPAYEITNDNITSWNNKLDEVPMFHNCFAINRATVSGFVSLNNERFAEFIHAHIRNTQGLSGSNPFGDLIDTTLSISGGYTPSVDNPPYGVTGGVLMFWNMFHGRFVRAQYTSNKYNIETDSMFQGAGTSGEYDSVIVYETDFIIKDSVGTKSAHREACAIYFNLSDARDMELDSVPFGLKYSSTDSVRWT